MVAGVAAGNISREATPPFGNIYAEAMRGSAQRVSISYHFQAVYGFLRLR
jgi:hypothetical protein